MLVILAWGDGEGDSGRGGPSEPSLASGPKERVTKKKKKRQTASEDQHSEFIPGYT